MILSVGGWDKGSEGFSKLVSSRENMLKFTKWVIIYLRRFDFDGLDFDWQFPALRDSSVQDKKRFADLCDVSTTFCYYLIKLPHAFSCISFFHVELFKISF